MKRWMSIVVVVLSMQAQAAEPLVLKVADAQEKRFLPLNKDSSDDKALQLNEKKFYPMRSDRSQMQNGAMRIDRPRAVPIPPQHALPTAKVADQPPPALAAAPAIVPGDGDYEPESEEITGLKEGIDPVLSLFDQDDGAGLTSFRDAMRGASTTVAGLVRHLIWPVPLNVSQELSSGYGMRNDPFHGRPTFHGGIDIAAATGTPVLATADGQVIDAKTDPNYGKYITVQHRDGTLTRYGHLSAQNVTEGQHVRAGQTIGAVGSTGRSTGAHLDYRVSKNGMKYDPLLILTVPSTVAMNGIKAPTVTSVATRGVSKVATNALPRAPMLIKVR